MPKKVSCAVRKDGGDDPDVTDKALIYAEVTFGTEEGIVIDGGFGVGRVTKPGLDQPVGNAAINHVPRQMIRENVEEIQKKLDDFRALQVIISVPEGEELAKAYIQSETWHHRRHFNPWNERDCSADERGGADFHDPRRDGNAESTG